MKFLDYFNHITVEDLVNAEFLERDRVVKNKFGYFIFMNCGDSPENEMHMTYLPLDHGGFKFFICSNDCQFSSLHLLSDTFVEDDGEYIDKAVDQLKKYDFSRIEQNITKFITNFEKYKHQTENFMLLLLIERFKIDIPAEAFKKEFFEGEYLK